MTADFHPITPPSALSNKRAAFQLINGGGYDPEEFYVGSRDAKGHWENRQVKMPPDYAGQIGYLVAQCPEYRTAQDFYRDAVVHTLAMRNKQLQDGRIAQFVDAQVIITRSKQRQAARAENMEAIRVLSEEAAQARGNQDTGTLLQILGDADDLVDTWGADDPLSVMLMDRLRDFQYLRPDADVRRIGR